MNQIYLIKNHHSSYVFELLKEGHVIKQGPTVLISYEGNIQLYSTETDSKECQLSIQDVFIFTKLEVQREKYRGEKVWITRVTNKMVYIELESGKTVRIPKTSLGVENWKNSPTPRRSPRNHKATKSPQSPIDARKLTFVEEVDEGNFTRFEEDVQVNIDVRVPTTTPCKKEVSFTESVVSDVRIFEALGNLRPLHLK
ncbi:hypothetical protein ACHAXS_008503 [Conticribra weissflogii]